MKLNREWITVSKSFVYGDKTTQFVEIKNMIITLNEGKSQRYLQLVLGITTSDDDDAKKVIAMMSVILAVTVNLLASGDYQGVRQTSLLGPSMGLATFLQLELFRVQICRQNISVV